jgi:glycosyltransferase involved in cell wall biosynthesis
MHEPFTALFIGKLIPLHGIETVLAAARLAPQIQFRVIGSGQLEHVLEDRPPNVDWVRWVEYPDLPAQLHACGCALGIFGTTAKALRVIPNKVFQALACGAPVITAESPAIHELGEDAMALVPPGDAHALADAVRLLANDVARRAELSARGLTAYSERASEAILGARWRALIEELL